MSPSTRILNEAGSSIPGLSEIKLGISRPVKKTLKEETDRHDDGKTEASAVVKVVSKSWRDKKRLYPPFRQGGKDVVLQEDEHGQEIVDKSIPDLKKIRPSVCIRRNQFPMVCTNIPLVCDEKSLDFWGSDFPCSSHGSDSGNEIPTTCGPHDAPCIGPICGQDDEPCNIRLGVERADNVCQDAVSAHNDKSEDVSVPGDKRKAQYHTTVCGESVDYVICENAEEATFTAFEEEMSNEEFEGKDLYLDIFDEEYENSGPASQNESKLEFRSESELFQDPLVSHRLTIPYKEMPPSRYCVGAGYINDSSETKSMAKRPRSPVRDIPEVRLDLEAGIAEVMRRAEIHKAKHALRKSKEWMDKMIISDSMSTPTSGTSAELLTTFLKVLLDDVSLTVGESDNDVSLTLATIWAITEFVMTATGLEITQSTTFANLGTMPMSKCSLSHNLTLPKATSPHQTSDIGYPPRGSDDCFLHRSLPWVYLCAAHAEGLPKSYRTIRTCIDEVTTANESDKPRAAYSPDMNSDHLNEVIRSENESAEKLH